MYTPSEKQLVQIEASLAAAIQERWDDAQLAPCLGNDVRAGLAAMVLLEASLDNDSPWEFRELVDLSVDQQKRPNESKPA